MTQSNNNPDTHSSAKRSAQLRLAGILVMALGISGAGLVYWLGTRSPDLSDDPAMLGFNKAEERQMGLMYGKMGTLIEDWKEDLKRPDTQAALIAGFAILVAGGCFYVARLSDNDDTSA